jgi:hypothetical protein
MCVCTHTHYLMNTANPLLCMYMYTGTHIRHTYTLKSTPITLWIRPTHFYAYIHKYTCTHIHPHTLPYEHGQPIFVHIYICTHADTHTHTHTHTHTLPYEHGQPTCVFQSLVTHCIYVCMYVCMCVWMYVFMNNTTRSHSLSLYIYICLYIYIHTHTHMHIHVCIAHACMHQT